VRAIKEAGARVRTLGKDRLTETSSRWTTLTRRRSQSRQGQRDDLEPYSHPTWSKRPSKVACRAAAGDKDSGEKSTAKELEAAVGSGEE
jgi:hypothetical protein